MVAFLSTALWIERPTFEAAVSAVPVRTSPICKVAGRPRMNIARGVRVGPRVIPDGHDVLIDHLRITAIQVELPQALGGVHLHANG